MDFHSQSQEVVLRELNTDAQQGLSATEVENRIYVPLRDIVEALGMGCHWIEPGIICIGPGEYVGMLYVNGGMERIMDYYGLN